MILDKLKPSIKAIPPDVKTRIDRGQKRMRQDSQKRNECLAFWRGDQYCYVNSDNYLVSQSTVIGSSPGSKPPHRIRRTWNLIHPVVEEKVSAATQSIPSYEVNPTTIDPADAGAAKLATKVAVYGYEKWSIRKVSMKVITLALVMREGFAMPYFDPSVPPYIDNEHTVGLGEIRIKTMGPNEVYWEPGVDFEDSVWHCIEQARSIDEVKAMPGYLAGKLTPDADPARILGTAIPRGQHNLVLVTEYLERPCSKYPKGRRLVFCNDRQIVPEEPYPCSEYPDFSGPVIHRVTYTTDPISDRDRGLVEHLIDPQRAYNAANNKILEWIQMGLSPQVAVQPGVLGRQKVTDEPGAVYEVPDPKNNFVWRQVPPIPPELRLMKQDAAEAIQSISAAQHVPRGVESAKAITAISDTQESQWESFMGNVSQFHSRLMNHCLVLVQHHYKEKRLLKVRGAYGPENIDDFRGADLAGQTDVMVSPTSLKPRTQAATEARVRWFAEMGWITPQAAMAAVNGGSAEKLVQSYEADISCAHRAIQKLKAGPEVFLNMPPRFDPDKIDPMTGQRGAEVPGFMPRDFDNEGIHTQVLTDWMKTTDYELSPQPVQHAADLYYGALKQLKADKEAEQAQAQSMMAEGLGMANAGKPQPGAKNLPNRPGADQQSVDPPKPPEPPQMGQ